jgi:general secretion pathway protein K
MTLAAFAAAVAVYVFAGEQRWARDVEFRRDQAQAAALAIAGIHWARQVLDEDARTTALDHPGEPWAMELPPIPLENGEIRGTIVDAQGRLNLNDLAAADAGAAETRRRFERLFARVGGPVGALDAIADWIDVDNLARPAGAEDAWYLGREVPGVAANAAVWRPGDLALVRGVDPAALALAAPFIVGLPMATPVNVNTAPVEVLASIVVGAGEDALATLAAERARRPFASVADFRIRLPTGATVAREDTLAVRSSWFIVSIEARQGATLARARALLHRLPDRWPAVTWQLVE